MLFSSPVIGFEAIEIFKIEKRNNREKKTSYDELNTSGTVWAAAQWSYGLQFQQSSSSNAT